MNIPFDGVQIIGLIVVFGAFIWLATKGRAGVKAFFKKNRNDEER